MQKKVLILWACVCLCGSVRAQDQAVTSIETRSITQEISVVDSQPLPETLGKEEMRAQERQQKEALKLQRKIEKMDKKNARLSSEERKERMQELQMEMDSLIRAERNNSEAAPSQNSQTPPPQTDKEEQRRLEREEKEAQKQQREIQRMDERNAALSVEQREAKKQELEEKMYQAVGEENEKQIERLKMEMDSLLRVEETEQSRSDEAALKPSSP